MASAAMNRWSGERATRLDELLDAHARVGGSGPGRRWRTTQLNRSLVLLLAAEFQGFARDLHDQASTTFADWAAGGNRPLERVIESRITEGRQLDRGNAQPGSLGSDFGRLGFVFWPTLAAGDPTTAGRQLHLEKLNDARNAIAHANDSGLRALRSEGYPITLVTFRMWRRSMDGLAGTMDSSVATQLGLLFGHAPPGEVLMATKTAYEVGDHVLVPWGLAELVGVVVEVYGPPGAPFVLVEVPVQGASGETLEATTVSFPASALEPVG